MLSVRRALLNPKTLCHARFPLTLSVALALGMTIHPPVLAQADNSRDGSSQAASELRQYSIAGGSLDEVLNRFALEAGIELSVSAKLTKDKASSGLNGHYSVSEGLQRLLAGSGLITRFTGEKSVTIEKAPADNPVVLQPIEVTGRMDQSDFADTTFAATKTESHILDIPQSVGIVTKEVIDDYNLNTLNDVAPYVAGVNEFSTYNDLTIRGFRNFDDRRVNGLRVYNNFWSQPYIANVERVEVIKGPSAVLFGQASPGGVINIVTKKPLTEARHEVRGDLSSFGSGNHQGLAALDSTGPLTDSNDLLYRINLSTWDQDSFRTEIFDKGYSLSPSISWVPSADTRVNLEFNYVNRESVLDRGQPNLADASSLGAVPIDVSVTQPGDGMDTEDFTVSISLDQALSQNWRLVTALQYHSYEEHLKEHRVSSNTPNNSEYNVRYNDRESEAETLSGTLYVTGEFNTGDVSHKLVVGADALTQEDDQTDFGAADVFVFDVLNPVNISRPVDSYTLVENGWGSDNERTGLFIQDQITLGDWDVLLGLRYSHFKTQPVGEDENSDSNVSPRLGVVYRATDYLSFFGTYAEGFEPNFGFTAQEGGPFDPTTSRLFEVGVKYLGFDDRLLATASVYRIVNDDIVVFANDSTNPDLYRQRGQERATGLELEAVGEITDRLSIIANYAYNDAEVTEDEIAENVGKTKEGAPRHAATLWGRYRIGGGFSLGAGVEHIGKRETFEDGFTLPSYTLYNAGIFFDSDDLSVSLLGKNLTDEEHWTGGYYPGRVYPGNPLQISLSARYEF